MPLLALKVCPKQVRATYLKVVVPVIPSPYVSPKNYLLKVAHLIPRPISRDILDSLG
jgi:hypothetical protein